MSTMPEAHRMFTGDDSEILKAITVDVNEKSYRHWDQTELQAQIIFHQNSYVNWVMNFAILCLWFYKSLDESVVPNDWKLANVCPVYKKGSRVQSSNYWPVSLTSQLCKLLESIICTAVVAHLEKHNLIKDSQHGFRRGRSCLTNLLEFLDKVTCSADAGHNIDIIYLDFAKAFDKVPHHRLIAKLEAHRNGGNILNWIR